MKKISEARSRANKKWNTEHADRVRYNRYKNSAFSFVKPKSKLQADTVEQMGDYYNDLRDLETLLHKRIEELK